MQLNAPNSRERNRRKKQKTLKMRASLGQELRNSKVTVNKRQRHSSSLIIVTSTTRESSHINQAV